MRQGDQVPKEEAGKDLSIFDSFGVGWAQRQAAHCPRDSGHEIRHHEDIVSHVVVGRGDVCPSSASKCSEYPGSGNDCGQVRTLPPGEEVEEGDESESRARCDGNEDHKDRAFRVPISNGRGNGRKPFLRIAVVLILDNFVIMEINANN